MNKNNINLLMLLLLTDSIFIFFHFLWQSNLLYNDFFSIKVDKGYAEIFQYVKEFWIASLLLAIAIRKQAIIYFFWALTFYLILYDDSMSIHELIGFQLEAKKNMTMILGISRQDLGELMIFALMSFSLIPIILVYKYSNKKAQIFSHSIAYLLAALVFFSVFIDLLATTLNSDYLSILEDAGELICMSFILWFIYNHAQDIQP